MQKVTNGIRLLKFFFLCAAFVPVVKTQKATPSHSPSMFANTVVVWTNPHKKICSNTKSEKEFYRKLHCPACAILNNMLCRFGIHVQGNSSVVPFSAYTCKGKHLFSAQQKRRFGGNVFFNITFSVQLPQPDLAKERWCPP